MTNDILRTLISKCFLFYYHRAFYINSFCNLMQNLIEVHYLTRHLKQYVIRQALTLLCRHRQPVNKRIDRPDEMTSDGRQKRGNLRYVQRPVGQS